GDVLTDEVAAPELDRIELQLARDLVELNLERKARLNAPVTALRPAARLVRVHARRIERVGREIVRPGEELARVVGGDEAGRRVRTAVDQDPRLHRFDFSFSR